MPKLLVIDDEPNIRFSIQQVFDQDEVEVLTAGDVEAGLRMAAEECPDVILLDIQLGSQSGLELFRQLRTIDPKCLVIFITGHGTAETAIEAMKLGAFDYLVKPLDATQLQVIVEQAFHISRLMHVPAVVEDGANWEQQADRLVGSGSAMQMICKKIGRLAPQDVNVLILGESGTGKELVARAIYHHSRRSQAPFVAINCAAIPESLLEDELFGHEKGAFTGADRRRIGKFEQCNGGTLFLDEIGDMPHHTQAKLLRLLQEKLFERLGGNESIGVDVRIIAATNQNLDGMIEQGTFRKDLYYRLRGATLVLPPLRERREDIAELAHYFLFRYNRQLGTAVQSISQEAMDLLERHDWPGNVREMQNAIRETMIASAGPSILPDFLPAELHRGAATRASVPPNTDPPVDTNWQVLPRFLDDVFARGETDIYRRAREYFDRILLMRAMQEAGGNQHRAAEILGLSRVTLRARLRSLGVSVERVVTGIPKDRELDSGH